MGKQFDEAVEAFKKGRIVIFPTDTAIGIGCRMDDDKAIKRLFEIRKRPQNKPLLILVDSVEMAEKYLLPIPEKVKNKLIKPFWPGKLTIVLKCNPDKVPIPVRSEKNTLGVRFPDNKTLLELIGRVGVPIVAPSANFSGEKTPFKFEELNPKLVKLADFVLSEKITLEKDVSTVIDCTVTPWRIIRQGATKIPDFNNVILILDTADNKKITVGININGKKDIQTKDMVHNNAQIILPMIDAILKKHSLKPEDISEIEVNIGPGSFTGLRVGIAIANALSFVLKIPVNGKKSGKIILPVYT
jgi:L-threonylcarbamoyladenylate synthase